MSRPLTLLCGMPRSGTTWLGKIFDSNPDTVYFHEPDSVRRIVELPLLADPARAADYHAAVRSFVETLPDLRHPKVAASLPVFRKSYYSPMKFGMARAAALAVKGAEKMLDDVTVPALVDFRKIPNLHYIWKSIELVGALGTVMRILPEARGVLILRHPCGYIASVARGESRGKFDDDVASAEDFGMFDKLLSTKGAQSRGFSQGTFRAMTPIQRLAWRWVLFNEKAEEELLGLQNTTRIIYEDACRDPMGEMRRLFAFADLTWHPQVEAFVNQTVAEEQGGYYSLFKDPLKSANKWRQELSAGQIDQVMAVVSQSPVGRPFLDRE